MQLSNYELCVKCLKDTVLPYLRHKCNLATDHNEANDFALVRFAGPKNFEEIIGYDGITISVSDDLNPKIESRPTQVSGCIWSGDGKRTRKFFWYNLDNMVNDINHLK